MKVLIADDEPPARSRLRRLLTEVGADRGLVIVGEAANGEEALELVAGTSPDAVFLDIEMPGLNGLTVAQSLGSKGPAVVFVTAFDHYAIRAFESAAIDYLLKPVRPERLGATLDRLERRLALKPEGGAPTREALSGLAAELKLPAVRRLGVRVGTRFVILDVERIAAVCARDHYAAILTEGRELLTDDSLDDLGSRLDPNRFFRIHRGSVINLDCLVELRRDGDRKYTAILNDPAATELPVSRDRLDELKTRLGL